MVIYDEEHVQISRIVRTYDERARVTSEENQALSPRLFAGETGTQGEAMPKELADLFAQALSQGPMRTIYKYDDHDRVIEQTNEMGLFGYEKIVSFYNERGDRSKQQHYSAQQRDIPVDEEGDILPPPPAPEKLAGETMLSYQYDDRGNWTRKETSTLHDPGSRWESVEQRLITYY